MDAKLKRKAIRIMQLAEQKLINMMTPVEDLHDADATIVLSAIGYLSNAAEELAAVEEAQFEEA